MWEADSYWMLVACRIAQFCKSYRTALGPVGPSSHLGADYTRLGAGLRLARCLSDWGSPVDVNLVSVMVCFRYLMHSDGILFLPQLLTLLLKLCPLSEIGKQPTLLTQSPLKTLLPDRGKQSLLLSGELMAFK